MHFSLATIVAASALLLPASTLAAPLPNSNSNNDQGCSKDDAPSVAKVGAGIGLGNDGMYHSGSGSASSKKGVKVKKGDTGSCPNGWTRSLIQVDLCIQVGGADHKKEVVRVAQTSHLPDYLLGAARATTTVPAHRASHTSKPKKQHQQAEHHDDSPDDEWVPRGGSTSSHQKPHRPASTTTTGGSGKKCRKDQTLGTGSFADVCLDIDSDPLYVGGGIKIGGHHATPSPSPTSSASTRGGGGGHQHHHEHESTSTSRPTTTTTTVRAEHQRTSTSSRSSPAPTPTRGADSTHKNNDDDGHRCGQNERYDALLDVCVLLDLGDPLFVGGAIRLGGSSPPLSDGSSSRGGGNNNNNNNSLLGNLLGGGGSGDGGSSRPLINLGGTNDDASNGDGNKNGNGSGNRGEQGTSPSNGRNDDKSDQDGKKDSRPACSGPNDPLAVVDLCVDVGNLLGAKVKLGGSGAPPSSTTTTSSRGPTPTANGTGRPTNENNGGNPIIQVGRNPDNGQPSPSSNDDNNNNTGGRGDAKPAKNGNKDGNNGDGDGKGSGLPPCNGPDDPNALLDLCVQVGNLLGASAKVGGSGPSSTSSAPRSNKTPTGGNRNNVDLVNGKPDRGGDESDDGNILDLNVADLLKVKIGSRPDGDSKGAPSSTTTTSPSFSPTPTPKHYKQTAPINTYPGNNNKPYNPDETEQRPRPKHENQNQHRPGSNNGDDGDEDPTPLLSVSASGNVKLGGGGNGGRPTSTSTSTPPPIRQAIETPSPSDKTKGKDCPVGQILHLGVCVDAQADVAGIVKASAAATVAV